MKKILFPLLALISVGAMCSAKAADPQKGISLFKSGLFAPAKEELLHSLNTNPADITACYYLGEVYYALNKPDSAAIFYGKGLAANPDDPYNRIGQAKLSLRTDPAQAAKVFDEVLKGRNRKDARLWIAVAQAYFAAGDHLQAAKYVAEAKKVDKSCAEAYLLDGDIKAAEENFGDAGSLYEQAVYFDPSCETAYLKYARIYTDINADAAIEMLQRLIERNPDAAAAWQLLAETYYKSNRLTDARDAYAKYMAQGHSSPAEQERYATLLYFSGDYAQSLRIVFDLLARNPDNVVMQRLKMYNLFEQQDYAAAKKTGDLFMEQPDVEHICQDYLCYGRLAEKERDHDLAIAAFQKALALDSTKVDIYKELGTACDNARDYEAAARHYGAFIHRGGDKVKVADYFLLGKSDYFAGNDTTRVEAVRRLEYLREADSLFGEVARRTPENYLGYFWQARTNASIDTDTELGLAKPYYEQAAAILSQDPVKNCRLLIECYSYLGYYYYLQKEMEQSKSYWQKILDLDPDNEVAHRALEGIK